ncbi:hypothetical protein [Oceanobacillus chungangensis]|uniref:hypothetical protein n=1 Tax=Oceanobacillus chungangensis TaxID=1229152 RepID=UPI0014732DA9|nr:hypothetical protein [Oceanobacillus chungangensis]
MNKYYRNIITIIFIVIFLILFTYWVNLNFGYGQLFLIIAGGYGIYLNLKAQLKVRKQT